jgi:hemoglobin
MPAADPSAQIASARPEMTATIMAETRPDKGILRALVHPFHAEMRAGAAFAHSVKALGVMEEGAGT